MVRLFSRTAVAVATAAIGVFLFGASPASPDIGLQTVNLACNDGTSLNLALGPTSLTALTGAIDAIALYPAGDPALACGVSPADPPASGSGHGNQDFAVGGGQFINFSRGTMCEQNFAISVHSPDAETPTPTSGGTANLSVPNSPACTGGTGRLSEGGELVTKPDCLQVTGDTADFTAVVTKATGTFADEGITPGGETSWEVRDDTPDQINVFPPGLTSGPCDFSAKATPATFTVDHGNITVNDNE
jgi:hypothetical protein